METDVVSVEELISALVVPERLVEDDRDAVSALETDSEAEVKIDGATNAEVLAEAERILDAESLALARALTEAELDGDTEAGAEMEADPDEEVELDADADAEALGPLEPDSR